MFYPTAIVATRGKYLDANTYVARCRREMARIVPAYLPPGNPTALEFGSGLGGNLVSVSGQLARGVGLDINRLYVRLAKKINRKYGSSVISFVSYDGTNLPDVGKFGLVFSLNVFERIPKNEVARYVGWMSTCMDRGASIVLFFLNHEAPLTGFDKKLGKSAYVYWTSEEARAVLESAGLHVRETLEWVKGAYLVVGAREVE